MRAARWLLVVVILLDLALVVVFLETRATRLRYALARKQERCRVVATENRTMMLEVARRRRPDELAREATRQGLTLREERRTEQVRP